MAGTPTTAPREVEPPEGLGALARAALPSLPVVSLLPGVRKVKASDFTGLALTRPPVTIERGHVDAFAAVCGFPRKDDVPLPYPHLLAFGLQMAIMGSSDFPAPAIGSVHIENSITQHRRLAVGETVHVTARVGAAVPHPKGTVYEFVTEVRGGDGGDLDRADLIWEETSAYLRRGKGESGASYGAVLPEADPSGVVWNLPGDLGRRYAAVSGDHNPIHLYPLTAKALGFKRQIAHGMWTMARCVAALENRLPDAVRVDVAFRKPVFLPGKVAFGSEPVDQGYAFSLSSPSSGSRHLLGRTTAL